MRALEWMIKTQPASNLNIRVWAKADDLRDNREFWRKSDLVVKTAKSFCNLDIVDVAEQIAKLDFCNAVEIIGQEGNGVLIYPEWP